jgi:hypothetical protein
MYRRVVITTVMGTPETLRQFHASPTPWRAHHRKGRFVNQKTVCSQRYVGKI